MRAVLLVLILAVLAIIVAILTGFLDISQIRGAKAPDLSRHPQRRDRQGGQTPAFDIETGSVKVGTGSQIDGPGAEPSKSSRQRTSAQNQATPVTNNAHADWAAGVG